MVTHLPTESQRYRGNGLLGIRNWKFEDLMITTIFIKYLRILLLFGIADLTRIARKKCPPHLVSLIKVEGLFSSYIVTHFDIVNSESLV